MIRMANILPWSSLRGAIGQRVRLLTFLSMQENVTINEARSRVIPVDIFFITMTSTLSKRENSYEFFYGLKRTIRSRSSPLDPDEQHAFHAWTLKLQGFAWHSPRHLPPSDTPQQRFAQTTHLLPPYNKLTKMKVKSSKTSYEFPYKPYREMTRRLSLRETCRNASGKL